MQPKTIGSETTGPKTSGRMTTGSRALRLAAALALAAPAGLATLAGASVLLAPGAAFAQKGLEAYAPAALVNGKAITNFEVDQRLKLLSVPGVGGGVAPTRDDALQSMIDSRLKQAAAEQAGIEVPPGELEAAMQRFGQAAGADTPAKLKSRLRQLGLSTESAKEFVETELSWSALIRRDYGAGAQVSEEELDAEIKAAGLDREVEYSLGEIIVPADGNPQAAAEDLKKVVEQIRAGADFETLARQRSRSRSAAQGGRLGWTPADRLPPQLRSMLAEMEPGDVTEPMAVPRAVVILTVFDERSQPRELTEEEREGIRLQILEQRLTRLAEGRLQELRARAYVERR